MKSSKSLQIIGRFIPLLLGILFLTRAGEAYQNQRSELSTLAALISAVAGVSLLITFVYLYRHIRVVELDNKGVSIIRNSEIQIISWQRVQSVRKYSSLLWLPFYKIELTDSDDFILFGSPLKFWDIGSENISAREINTFIALRKGSAF